MRVIGGKYHGMKLRGIRGDSFRPTTQMVKGAILDSLYGDIQGGRFLDLYAGSGGVGIEALSRGAEKAVFVEKNGRAVKVIEDNLRKCGVADSSFSLVRSDAMSFIASTAESDIIYDVIFADPPYHGNDAVELVKFVCGLDFRICRILIVESSEEISSGGCGPGIRRRVRNYGQTYINYFRF